MVSSSSPVAAVKAAPPPRGTGRDEPPAPQPKASPPVEPKPFAEMPSHQAAARAPADLSVIPAAAGSLLIYIFHDHESGERLRQYPTEAYIALGEIAGRLFDRQV